MIINGLLAFADIQKKKWERIFDDCVKGDGHASLWEQMLTKCLMHNTYPH